jgi:drug/metabolite transporter (DMT)-like permease
VSELVLAVVLCIVSAAGYAGAAVLQERLAQRPLGVLVRTPLWWAAIALNGVGAGLHVVALRFGPLSLVQPFGVLTLVLAVPLAAVLARRAVTRLEGRGIGLAVAGLVGILLLAGTTSSIAVLSSTQLVGLLLVTAALLTALGGWSAVPGASGLWAAAAAGVSFGVSSALTQTVAVHLTDDGLGALIDPTVAVAALAIVVLSTAGTLFTQRSYRDGLGAPLAVSTLANPVAAATIGLVLLGEQITGGALGAVVALASAGIAAAGVTLLTRAQVRKATPAPAPAARPGLPRRTAVTATSSATAQPVPAMAATSRVARVPTAASSMPPQA